LRALIGGQTPPARLLVGTAGWVVPSNVGEHFPPEGSHLQRYATRFSPRRSTRPSIDPTRRTTYERWAASVPEDFRFSVKLPKAISHAPSTNGQEALIGRFSEEVHGLGGKLGVVLVQFPPKRVFDKDEVVTLFGRLAAALLRPIACEPRHQSWFTPVANDLLQERTIARVAADPPRSPRAGEPGGWPGLAIIGCMVSPIIYRSSYVDAALAKLSEILMAETPAGAQTWCIFDNTASSAATGNAMTVADLLNGGQLRADIAST
jgi:uncharacterized protein YecE (DUF72 family)